MYTDGIKKSLDLPEEFEDQRSGEILATNKGLFPPEKLITLTFIDISDGNWFHFVIVYVSRRIDYRISIIFSITARLLLGKFVFAKKIKVVSEKKL
jgi:hypothetical protein